MRGSNKLNPNQERTQTMKTQQLTKRAAESLDAHVDNTKNQIKTGYAPAFTIEVIDNPQGWGEQWARTETKWNAGNIEWCDWRPISVAKTNLADFLADEGNEADEIKMMLRVKLGGLKWGQMKAGKTLNL